MNQHIPQEKRILAGWEMTHRKENKKPVTQISHELGISRSHLYSLESKYYMKPEMLDFERTGRPSKIDDRGERRILRMIRNQPFEKATILTKEYNIGMEEENKISESLFKEIACENDLKAMKPSKKPPLKECHIKDRLRFANNYVHKDLRFWRHVLFADEASLHLHPNDNKDLVRRPTGDRYLGEFVHPIYKHEGDSLMFWGSIGWNGQGVLRLVTETISGKTYAQLLCDVIPATLERLNMHSAILIEDHATSHDTRLVINTKSSLNLRILEDYPSNSPDLNPVEHVWAYWKKRVRQRLPRNLEELEIYALEEWENIPLEFIHSCILSMPNRLAEIIKSHGGYTKY